jgi:hypothetical protein
MSSISVLTHVTGTSTSSDTTSTTTSTTNINSTTPAQWCPDPQQNVWVKSFQRGFEGDVIALLSVTMAAMESGPAGVSVFLFFIHRNCLPTLTNIIGKAAKLEQLKATLGWSNWPTNFLMLSVTPKATTSDPHPVETRLQHIRCLDKRLPAEMNGTDFPPIAFDDFLKRLNHLRKGTYDFGAQRIKEIFVENLSDMYPDLRVNGRKIKSIRDFCSWIKQGPWDDAMRNIVHYAQDGMWESDNKWAINLEKEYCNLLAISWLGSYANELHQSQRNTEGNCAHALFVKKKASMMTTIRDTTKRTYLEAIYARIPAKREAFKNTSKIPQVIEFTRVIKAVSGFYGILAYCEGHPRYKIPELVMADSPSGDNASAVSSQATEGTADGERYLNKPRKPIDDASNLFSESDVSIDTGGCEEDSHAISTRKNETRLLESTLDKEARRHGARRFIEYPGSDEDSWPEHIKESARVFRKFCLLCTWYMCHAEIQLSDLISPMQANILLMSTAKGEPPVRIIILANEAIPPFMLWMKVLKGI